MYLSITKDARLQLEIGKQADGYMTNEKFTPHAENAFQIFTSKYPGVVGVWLFDHSGTHKKRAADALSSKRMNLGDGGAQPKMHATSFVRPTGEVIAQEMVFPPGHPLEGKTKGMKTVLTERGLWREGMTKDQAMQLLGDQPDFKYEKCILEVLAEKYGQRVVWLPKFHCELNPIERVWCQSKQYTRQHTQYNMAGLKNTVAESLARISINIIRKYFRKAKDYMELYREGTHLADIPKLLKQKKSHRAVTNPNK